MASTSAFSDTLLTFSPSLFAVSSTSLPMYRQADTFPPFMPHATI
jgi:hypothetical protein